MLLQLIQQHEQIAADDSRSLAADMVLSIKTIDGEMIKLEAEAGSTVDTFKQKLKEHADRISEEQRLAVEEQLEALIGGSPLNPDGLVEQVYRRRGGSRSRNGRGAQKVGG